MAKATRALGVLRISEVYDDSTSLARQREIILAAASIRGSKVVAWAEDPDISASKVPPMKRPALAARLAEQDTFDEVLFWRLDRFVRSPADLTDMIRWAREHAKGLASATESFDLDTPLGEAMAYMAALFAGMESNTNRERVTGAHKYMREHGRWGGSKPPYGYVPAKIPGSPGFSLIEDPETAPLLREAVRRATAGEASNAICADFNERKVPSPSDRLRALPAKSKDRRKHAAPRGVPWQPSSLRVILRSPAMLGLVVHNGQSVPGEDGMPVRLGPPLVSQTDYDRLQASLDQAAKFKTRTQTASLLLNVAYCTCGDPGEPAAPLYHAERVRDGRVRLRYYLCAAKAKRAFYGDRCDALSITADILDSLAASAFLDQVGDTEVMERVYIPGEDHSEELAQVRSALASVRAEFDRGNYSYPGGQADYDSRVDRLSGRLATLAALPIRVAGYARKPTGATYRQLWDRSDTPARRKLMMDSGFEIRAKLSDPKAKVLEFAFRLDPELAARAQAAAAGEPVELPDHDATQAAYEWSDLMQWADANAPVRPESEWTAEERRQALAIRAAEAGLERKHGHRVNIVVDTTPES